MTAPEPSISQTVSDILIVDDQLYSLQLLTTIFSAAGYQVREAVNGLQAIEAVQSTLPDLILLDIMMPNMNGYQVCERLKADPHTQMIPIIFVSALDDTESKVNAFAAGAIDYITKPFRKGEMLARARTHLQIQTVIKTLQVQNNQLVLEIEQLKILEAELVQTLTDLRMAQE
jgi:PleD family two-component response regulator